MSLQDRVTNILLRPQEEWTVIAGERSRMSELYLSYVAPLAAIGPLASVVGLSVIGYGNPVTGHYRVAFGNSITQAVVTYVSSLIGIYVLAVIIERLTPFFSGWEDQREAFQQLVAEHRARHDVVHEHLRGELGDVDVSRVLFALRLHVGRALALGQLHDLVVVDRVHGRLGPHDRDLPLRERERRVGLERRPAHRVQPGTVALADDHRDLRHGRLRGREDHLRAVADDPLALDLGPDHEPGDVGEVHEGDVVGVAEPDEPRRLVGGVREEDAALHLRLVGDDPDGPAAEARPADDDLAREEALDLEPRPRVHHTVDDLVHVEILPLVVGHDLVDRPAGLGVDGVARGRQLPVRLRHVPEVVLGKLDRDRKSVV